MPQPMNALSPYIQAQSQGKRNLLSLYQNYLQGQNAQNNRLAVIANTPRNIDPNSPNILSDKFEKQKELVKYASDLRPQTISQYSPEAMAAKEHLIDYTFSHRPPPQQTGPHPNAMMIESHPEVARANADLNISLARLNSANANPSLGDSLKVGYENDYRDKQTKLANARRKAMVDYGYAPEDEWDSAIRALYWNHK
jgi:hypothetical protein